MTEEWRPVVGYEGNYEVSDAGRVRSLDRTVPSGRTDRGPSRRKGRILVPVRANRYLTVCLSKYGVRRSVAIHALVCEAFNGPRPSLLHMVRHIDGDSHHNVPDNLAWGLSAENAQDTLLHGRHSSKSKTSCVNGHPYTEENTVRRAGGQRQCRICQRASRLRRSEARRIDNPPDPVHRAKGLRIAQANSCPDCGRSNALTRTLRADGSRICRWEKSGLCISERTP